MGQPRGAQHPARLRSHVPLPGTRSAMNTTPQSSCTTSTPPRARACSTAGPTSWATCSRCGGVGMWIPEGHSLTPVPGPRAPGGCSPMRTFLCAPHHGAPGCRGRFIRTPLTRVLTTHCTGRRPRLCLGETHAMGSQPDVRAVCTHKAPLPQGSLLTSGGTCLLDAGTLRSPPSR